MASALAGFPVEPHTRFTLHFGPRLRMISDMPEIPEPAREKLSSPPAGLGFSGWVAYRGRTVKFGMRIDLRTVLSYVAGWMR